VAGVGAHRGDLLAEGLVRAEQPLERHRSGDLEQLGEVFGEQQRRHADSAHRLGAVDQGEALFGLEHQRLQARALQRFGPGQARVVEEGFALADQHQREVGERCEVTGGATLPRSGTTGVTRG